MKLLSPLILIIFFPFLLFAQKGYNIELQVPQLSAGEPIYLAYHYGENILIADTAVTEKKGRISFSGAEALPGGMYLIALPEEKIVELLLTEDQNFMLEISDTAQLVETTKVKGSQDNKLLYEFQRYITKKQKQFSELAQKRAQFPEESDSAKLLDKEADALEKEIEAHWKQLAETHPETFFATVLRANMGSAGKIGQFGWFFDNVDFSDERLLRSPIIFRTIRQVLARNLNNNKPPEFIMQELQQLIQKAEANQKVYEYTVTYLLTFFNGFQRVGMNRVFVFIAENYVLNGRADWLSDDALQTIAERTSEMRATFIGEPAPDIRMQTIKGDSLNLYALNKPYTLVFFWSTGCGHCEAATEALNAFFQTDAGSKVDIFAVYTKESKKDWEKYVEEYNISFWHNVWDAENKSNYRMLYYVVSTPLLYVLDSHKKIIGFRAGDGPISELLNQLEADLAE